MRSLSVLLLTTFMLAACGGGPEETVYDVRGRLVDTAFGGLALRVDHEAIPGYMEAMRMTFRLQSPEDARGLEPGDVLSFEYVVTPETSYIRDIERLPDDTELDLPHLENDADTLDVPISPPQP